MKKLLVYLSIIFGVIILDQVSKGILLGLILGTVPLSGPAWTLVPVPYLMAHVCDIFNIVFTWNPGASFSILRGLGETAPYAIIFITSFIIGFLMYYLFTRAQKYERIGLALVAGGAIGNLIDRLRFGAVIDFLDFHIGGMHWPAFNVADICIVVGVGIYILSWFIARQKCLKSAKGEK